MCVGGKGGGVYIRPLLLLLSKGREGVCRGRAVVEKKGLVVSWWRDRRAWVNIDVGAGDGCGWGGWGGGGVEGDACHFGPMAWGWLRTWLGE